MSLTDAPSSMVSIVSPVRGGVSSSSSGRTVAGVAPVLVGASVSSAPELRGRAYLVHHVFYEDGNANAGDGGVAPASKESITALREVDEEEGNECAICLDDGEASGGRRKEMPCGHRFHGECVGRWLGIHGSCPLCRREMPAAAEEEVVVAMVNGERVVMRGRRVVLSVLVVGAPILPTVLIDDLD